MRRPLRSAFVLGVLAGLVVALVRALAREGRPGPAPLAAGTMPVRTAEPAPIWVAPVDGACPDGFPIKAKETSGIYHHPGGLSYARTRPDRCYADEAAAEADGFRAAKR
ncbi:MAG TPA: hypothetical protein VGO60_11265 [Iamia sp.]|jgi:micrococcal nuclease|nr:hypothetical protein [Iamia sp.]